MVAVIAAHEASGLGAASMALHATAGFVHTGRLSNVGYKFGRWLDLVFMQRALGAGDTSPPVESALPLSLRQAGPHAGL